MKIFIKFSLSISDELLLRSEFYIHLIEIVSKLYGQFLKISVDQSESRFLSDLVGYDGTSLDTRRTTVQVKLPRYFTVHLMLFTAVCTFLLHHINPSVFCKLYFRSFFNFFPIWIMDHLFGFNFKTPKPSSKFQFENRSKFLRSKF